MAVAKYSLDELPNRVLAAEYKTMLPGEKEITKELNRTRLALLNRQRPAISELIDKEGRSQR